MASAQRTTQKGFLATFKFQDIVGDRRLTVLRIFIPVASRGYAFVIASTHRAHIQELGFKLTAPRLRKVEMRFK